MKLLDEMRETSFTEAFMRRILEFTAKPPYSEPWPEEVDDAVRRPDAVLVCHRCLAPQKPGAWFCPECGAAVGPYNNVMPYLYIFSMGEGFRAGVQPEAHYTPLTKTGYALAALSYMGPLAILYYLRMLQNGSRCKTTPPPAGEGVARRADGV